MDRKLCVGVNSNLDEVKFIAEHPASKFIKEIFIGPPSSLGRSDRKHVGTTNFADLPEYVRICHENGIELNIAANARDYNGQEFNPNYINEFLRFYEHLGEIGVDSLTLGNSTMLENVGKHKQKNGGIKIGTSVYLKATTPLMAEEFAKFGAERIILPGETNHDFSLQKRIFNYLPDLEYELYATTKCVSCGSCPHRDAHSDFKSSHGEYAIELRDKGIDPVVRFCKARRAQDTLDSLFTGFVRPEDIELYEQNSNGKISMIKLATREASREKRLEQVIAYGNRTYDGALADLWTMGPKDLAGIPNKALDGALAKVKHLYPEEQKVFYQHLSDVYDSIKSESKEKKIEIMQDTIKNY